MLYLNLQKINKKYSESEIASLLQKKDSSILEYIYNEYGKALFGVIYSRVKDKELAEEILQESMLKVWNNSSKYNSSRGRFYTWVLTITRNTTTDVSRSKAYKLSMQINTSSDVLDVIDTAGSYNLNEDSIGIREVIEELNTKYMQVIDMLYFKGYSQSETAKKLDLPLGTVKTRIRRALELLKQRIS